MPESENERGKGGCGKPESGPGLVVANLQGMHGHAPSLKLHELRCGLGLGPEMFGLAWQVRNYPL